MHVRDVHAFEHERAKQNHQTYKLIFEACCKRIRHQAAIPNAPRWMDYRVPGVVWDRPPFKHHHAVRYLVEKFNKRGFTATALDPSTGQVRIEWPRCPALRRRRAPKPSRQKLSGLSKKLMELRKSLA
jgi:hypothetical protein